MSILLYYSPGSGAQVPHVLLEEAGLDYELRRLDAREPPSGEQPLLHNIPSRRAPALVDGTEVVFETGAIILHILAKQEASYMMPAYGSPDGSRFLQWLFYLITTPQQSLLEYYTPERWATSEEDREKVRHNGMVKLIHQCDFMESHVAQGSFMPFGFTALDIYLTMLARWTVIMEIPMTRWDRLGAIIEATRERPSFQKMMRMQEIAWPETD